MTPYETLLVRTEDGIGFITFNRPEKRNAMNPLLHKEMNLALDELIDDEAIAQTYDSLVKNGGALPVRKERQR